MMKRLFIGFPIELSSSLAHALKRVRIDADKKEMEFFWTPQENLHVTVNFLGDTPPERQADLEALLERATLAVAPFKTTLKGMGAFPDDHHMRVLWVGVRKSRALATLQSDLREQLVEAGFEQEERDYLPHLTVGRLRKARTAVDLMSPFVRTNFDDLHVPRIVLYESVIANKYPVYKKLREFELRGADDESISEE